MSVKSTAELLTGREAFFSAYKDKRWKAFSKRVREFHSNVCAYCRASDKTTNVHHWKYYPGRMPWEYELGEVALLCVECHDVAHKELQNFRRFVFPRISPKGLRVINGAIIAGLSHYNELELAYAFAELVATPGAVKRFCNAWKPMETCFSREIEEAGELNQ